MKTESVTEKATLGGGCFWCLEAVFEGVRGVTRVVSGYAGGRMSGPTYEQVCTGTTGHAEVVQITFDPEQVSYTDLLGVFFGIHDPTQLDRQGPDVGSQYRSAVFTHSAQQATEASAAIAELERDGIWDGPVVTRVEPLDVFYPAEDYHQEYYRRNEAQPYCAVVVAPKVAKFRERFRHLLKEAGDG